MQHVMDAYIDLASAYAQRGSAYDAKFYLTYAEILSRTVRSAALSARTKVKIAALKNRLRQVEDAKNKLLEATTSLAQVSLSLLTVTDELALTMFAAGRPRRIRLAECKRRLAGKTGYGPRCQYSAGSCEQGHTWPRWRVHDR